MGSVIVKLDNVSKKYRDKYIIKKMNLEIMEGEFLTLLGPSGCGKTTILRLISGLEHVTDGSIYIGDSDVTNMDAEKREVNTIFQNLALFPHMTVRDNIGFGLKMKHVNSSEIEKKVNNAIKLVKLNGFEDRYPRELSGGQQQRVAIARGIVMNPKVLLLDECLCSLDLKLKRQMQIELKKIQRKLGITFIYVTHDQNEALTMSDRIVILNKGIIQQNDTPKNIYDNPKNVFVADFIGEANIIKGSVVDVMDRSLKVSIGNNILTINKDKSIELGMNVHLMIRPENVEISNIKLNNSILGVVDDIIYDGNYSKVMVSINDLMIKVNAFRDIDFKYGDNVYIKFDKSKIKVIEGDM